MVLYQDLGTRLHKTVLSRKRRGGERKKNKKGAAAEYTGSANFSFLCFWFIRLTRLHSVICMKMYDEPKRVFVYFIFLRFSFLLLMLLVRQYVG